MSWQAYVDSSLLGTGDVDQAAIFSADGTGVWASSAGFKVTPSETKAITAGFKDSNALSASGLHVNGEKYVLLKSDDQSIYGKKGKEGVIIVKTKQAMIIAHYGKDTVPGTATNTVEKLGDYLRSVGY